MMCVSSKLDAVRFGKRPTHPDVWHTHPTCYCHTDAHHRESTLIPTTAHRQRVDDRNIASTIAFRISGNVQHEKAVLEPGVVCNVRLLFKPLQQSDLCFGPFVKQTKVRAGTIAHINTGKAEDQRIAEQRVLCRNSEGKTRLSIRVTGLVIALFVAVARGSPDGRGEIMFMNSNPASMMYTRAGSVPVVSISMPITVSRSRPGR